MIYEVTSTHTLTLLFALRIRNFQQKGLAWSRQWRKCPLYLSSSPLGGGSDLPAWRVWAGFAARTWRIGTTFTSSSPHGSKHGGGGDKCSVILFVWENLGQAGLSKQSRRLLLASTEGIIQTGHKKPTAYDLLESYVGTCTRTRRTTIFAASVRL